MLREILWLSTLMSFYGLASTPDKVDLHEVSGEIAFPKKGTIHIALLDEVSFNGGKGIEFGTQIVVGEEKHQSGKIRFIFKEVPAGTYGIRAFQDVNGNDKFDIGMMGPKEPWGTYRHSRPRFSGPKFKEMAFPVNEDVTDINFKLK
jgi:uncharacterized protein (DUF2141 family)